MVRTTDRKLGIQSLTCEKDLEIYERSEAFAWKNDDYEFHYTKLILKSGNDQFFYATTPERLVPNFEVDFNKLKLVPIPMEDVWPTFVPGFTQVPEPSTDLVYIKKPSLLHYGDTEDPLHIGDNMLNEMAACEILRKNPHPNIATYLGCIVVDGKIRGLCYTKYSMTLAQRVNIPTRFNARICRQRIGDGVDHLHKLRLIHNDLKPENIMVDDNDNPIIIDFDSCKMEGEKLGNKAGTNGWRVDSTEYAIRENDFHALEKLDSFLQASLRNE